MKMEDNRVSRGFCHANQVITQAKIVVKMNNIRPIVFQHRLKCFAKERIAPIRQSAVISRFNTMKNGQTFFPALHQALGPSLWRIGDMKHRNFIPCGKQAPTQLMAVDFRTLGGEWGKLVDDLENAHLSQAMCFVTYPQNGRRPPVIKELGAQSNGAETGQKRLKQRDGRARVQVKTGFRAQNSWSAWCGQFADEAHHFWCGSLGILFMIG
jgi:hypothetical protein